MSEDPGTLGIHLPKPLIVVAALAAGVVLGVLLLVASARPAGASVLPGLPPVTQTITPVATTVSDDLGSLTQALPAASPAPQPPAIVPAVASITTSVTNGLVQAGGTSVHSLAGGTLPTAPVLPLPLPALPVLSAPPVLPVLGAVVNQGPPTTTIVPSQLLSATALGVVIRTGSAEFALGNPTSGDSAIGSTKPAGRPSSPTPASPNPLGTLGASSGSGAHGSPLDSLPPTLMVLALIVVGGLELERRRRPKARFDLRFCPPG